MNLIVIVFCFFSIIPIVYLQDLTSSNSIPIIIYNTVNTSNILFTFSNSQNGISYTLHCEFTNTNVIGYTEATFTNSTATGTGGTLSFTINIQNLVIGRVRPFFCRLNNPASTNVTQYLSYRPAITAMVCSVITVMKTDIPNPNVVIPVKFSDPLVTAGPLSCTSSQINSASVNVPLGAVSTTVTVQYRDVTTLTSDVVSCTFTAGPTFSFTANIQFQSRFIGFFPNTIVTTQPVIQLSLISSSAPSADILLNCSVVPVSQSSCSAVPTGAPINWTLSSTRLVLQANVNQAASITVIRNGLPLTSVEVFNVMCCDASNTPYIASITVNNSTLQIPQVLATSGETQYVSDLRFEQLSSCPCDLTVAVCDPNCCCDTFCNCSGGVVPIPGPYGGFFSDSLPRSCQYRDALTTPGFHSVMCVQNESPNIIGDYYPMQPVITNLAAFTNVLSSSSRSSGIQIRFSSSDLTSPTFSNDSSLISITSNTISQSIGSPQFLYLPKQAPSTSGCQLTNPITMLQPYSSSCPYTITNENCVSLTDPRLSSQFYLMSSTLTATTCQPTPSIGSIQGNIPIFSFYYSEAGIQFSWDNGYTAAPVPQLSNNLCTNVVKSASYTIYYNTTGVAFMSASIVLGDAPVNSALNQKFSASFVPSNVSASVAASASFAALQSASVAPSSVISGLYGYDDGKPILSVNSRSSRAFSPIRSLPITLSGMCSEPPTNTVGFRQTTLSQCKFDLSPFASCADRRNAIANYINLVLNNSFVAVYGNPSSDADFVPVTETVIPSIANPTPSGILDLQFTAVPLNNLTSYCTNVTTGIVVTVYYTRQGKDRNEYIHNIVGVVKRFSNSNLVNFSPYGSNPNRSNFVTLSSYVEFIMVPAGITGVRSTDDKIQAVCYFDICINEIFYPWLYNYEGKQGFYEQTFGIFLLGLAIFLLVTAYPWW